MLSTGSIIDRVHFRARKRESDIQAAKDKIDSYLGKIKTNAEEIIALNEFIAKTSSSIETVADKEKLILPVVDQYRGITNSHIYVPRS